MKPKMQQILAMMSNWVVKRERNGVQVLLLPKIEP